MPAFFEQGFSVREPMWHGLGTVLEDYPGREEAMALAGHDFQVVERPFMVLGNEQSNQPQQPYAVNDGKYYGVKNAKGWKALIHNKNGSILNVVKDSYGVVQNDVLWDIVDALVNEPNVKYETAGVLKAGAVLWVLAKLDEPQYIEGDVDAITGEPNMILPYITASTTHDGSGAAVARATSVRIVCWNTYSAAASESKQSGREFTFRHTKNVMEKIAEAKDAINGVRAEHDAFMEMARELATVKLTVSQRDLWLSQFIPLPPEALISDRVVKNVDDARNAVKAILNSRTTPEAHRLTGYGLWQAGIEYMDHLRGYRSSDTYFGRSMLRQEVAKDKLAKQIMECAVA